MKVRLNSLKDGKQIVTGALDATNLDITDLELSAPVTVLLTIDKGVSEIKIDGQVESVAHLECDRCLNDINLPIKGTFSAIASFSTIETSDKDENIIPLSPTVNEIDLTEYIHDTLLLGIPMKIVCREDCKGLCPVCGANRNDTDCQCQTAKPDARWETLTKLTTKITEDQ
jgi:uncharacterized protein